MAFIFSGNFATHAALAGHQMGSRAAYAELFEALASILSEFPVVLRAARFIFLPGDNDPWISAYSGGSATLLPRHAIPAEFTASIRKAFTMANADVAATPAIGLSGDAVWTTNPSRISFLGTVQEIVIFRDDMLARIRRNCLRFPGNANASDLIRISSDLVDPKAAPSEKAVELGESNLTTKHTIVPSDKLSADITSSRKLVKTLLDQSYLSPFPLQKRPVLWEAAGALRLYPLPTALILVDPEAPSFGVTYEGCHVMNPGKLIDEGRRNSAKWMEYDTLTKRSQVLEIMV